MAEKPVPASGGCVHTGLGDAGTNLGAVRGTPAIACPGPGHPDMIADELLFRLAGRCRCLGLGSLPDFQRVFIARFGIE